MQLLRQLTDRVYLCSSATGRNETAWSIWPATWSCDHLVRFVGHRDDAARLIGLFNVFWLGQRL